ncbi:MAG: replication-associated recombination protein A, partial [Corynebacterium matruchotii]
SGGDARRSLTYLEAAAESVPDGGELSVDVVAANIDRAVVRYDRDGDQHYDVASAFIKSIRGSDVDAAVHYLARMLVAGEDPRFVARRLVIAAAEDVGLADPQALSVAVAAADAVQLIGMPEARLPLAEATIYLATAPKSNAAYVAIDQAMGDVRAAKSGVVPPHLRDGHYAGAQDLGNAVGYVYPHDDPHGVVAQQYLPDSLAGMTYYRPTMRGNEGRLAGVVEKLRALIRGEVLK